MVVDCGMKHNMIRCFVERGAEVTVVPWNHDFTDMSKWDGLFISNGPGDPAMCEETVQHLRKVIDVTEKPIFGICLGNQLISRAAGATTNALVELVDLYPTLAGLAELPPPPGLEGQGTDLGPLFDAPTRGATFKNASFSQYPVCSPPTHVREFTAGSYGRCATCPMCRAGDRCSTNATVDTWGLANGPVRYRREKS